MFCRSRPFHQQTHRARRNNMRRAFHGGGPASSNWRYFTDADRTGPRKSEFIMSTMEAKKRFHLETSDLCAIMGYRQPGARSTLTMYYVNDLKAASIAKHGQTQFDTVVPEGRELSGIAQKERDAKTAKEAAAAQASADRAPFAVVPPERLANCYLDKLQQILVRCEGGKKEPYCVSKDQCIARILASGKYDLDTEAKLMAEQKAAEEVRQAQLAAERAAAKAAREQEEAVKQAKAAAAATLKAERLEQFERGALSADALKYDESTWAARLEPANACARPARLTQLIRARARQSKRRSSGSVCQARSA